MAYLVELRTNCVSFRCTKRAVVELFSARNDPSGTFCREHGNRALDLRNRGEFTQAEVAKPRALGLPAPEGEERG